MEEGILDIEKYLDDATIVGLKEVQIIHGKGISSDGGEELNQKLPATV